MIQQILERGGNSAFWMGMVAMGFAISALFFLKFWNQSRDRLFLLFAMAFMLLAVNRWVRVVVNDEGEISLIPYVVRLLAFLMILLAIIDRNLRRK
jgi:hypothetical protein